LATHWSSCPLSSRAPRQPTDSLPACMQEPCAWRQQRSCSRVSMGCSARPQALLACMRAMCSLAAPRVTAATCMPPGRVSAPRHTHLRSTPSDCATVRWTRPGLPSPQGVQRGLWKGWSSRAAERLPTGAGMQRWQRQSCLHAARTPVQKTGLPAVCAPAVAQAAAARLRQRLRSSQPAAMHRLRACDAMRTTHSAARAAARRLGTGTRQHRCTAAAQPRRLMRLPSRPSLPHLLRSRLQRLRAKSISQVIPHQAPPKPQLAASCKSLRQRSPMRRSLMQGCLRQRSLR
jgi:hypothetical protein